MNINKKITHVNKKNYNFYTYRRKHSKQLCLKSDLRHNPLKEIDAWVQSKKHIFNLLLSLDGKYKGNVFIGQRHIASICNIERETANRMIAELTNDGVIAKVNRGPTECLYKINDFFRSVFAKTKLSILFPAILSLSATMSYDAFDAEMEKCHTIYNKVIYYKYNNVEICNRVNKRRYNMNKEDAHIEKCIANQKRNKEQFKLLLKREHVAPKTTGVEPPKVGACTKLVPYPTIEDIPKEQLQRIYEHPACQQQKMINARLQAIYLIRSLHE